jgi:hypothetical protein
LCLIQEVSHINSYSMRKPRGKRQTFASCDRLTFPCSDYLLGNMRVGSSRSIRLQHHCRIRPIFHWLEDEIFSSDKN